jgi:hypothetical protein
MSDLKEQRRERLQPMRVNLTDASARLIAPRIELGYDPGLDGIPPRPFFAPEDPVAASDLHDFLFCERSWFQPRQRFVESDKAQDHRIAGIAFHETRAEAARRGSNGHFPWWAVVPLLVELASTGRNGQDKTVKETVSAQGQDSFASAHDQLHAAAPSDAGSLQKDRMPIQLLALSLAQKFAGL